MQARASALNAPAPAPEPSGSLIPRVVKREAGSHPISERLARETRADVLFDPASRGRYATDASIYQVMPIGVAVPRDEEDLEAVLAIARDAAVPVLPRGAGSSQCGQTVGEALVIDHSRHLGRVVDFDREGMRVSVQPGMVYDRLNAWLKPHGVWFPVDVSTGAQATIGGMAGNNSCGSRSIEYGNMVHNVLGIEALLADGASVALGPESRVPPGSREAALLQGLRAIADRERGEIERAVPKVLRRVGGYNLDVFHPQSVRPYTGDGAVNLAHLLVGSEGTLAWFKRLSLRLAPLPRHRVLGVVSFPTFYRAMDSAQHIVRLGPTAVELVDRTMIELSRENPAFRPVIDAALVGEPDAILLTEFSGEDREALLARLDGLVELMGELGLPGAVVRMTDASSQRELWEVRKAGLNIMMSLKGDGKPVSFIEDCAVPLEHLAEYTDRLTEVFRRHGTKGTWYAHASVGTLHVRPILDMRRDGAAKMRAIAEEASAMVRQYKGAYSGEHGDGLSRSEWVSWQFGPRLTRAFEEVKALFDPQGLFNPGKIVRPPRMDEPSLFRFKPGYQRLPHRPALDWSAWDVDHDPATGTTTAPGTGGDLTLGLGKAVEMCNNNGHCRKFDAGTMCPSYRVTLDEQHVTRGRANTLRLALSGQLGAEGIAGPDVKEALELCVSCKGCKRDCPVGVDMARMKIEARAAWSAAHGLSLRERIFAYLPRYAPLASRFRGLVNLRNRSAWLRGAGERWTGISAKRALPEWRKPFLQGRAAAPEGGAATPTRGEVVLLVDTFNNHFEPENARAALRVLEAAGYRVHLAGADQPRPLCCGRTFLAAGLVEEARAEAGRLVAALSPFVARGVPVVGLEPSCTLGLRDELTGLIPGEDARDLARAAFTFEEFLDREHAAGRLRLALQPMPGRRVLLHGHCHQKAFGVLSPVERVLALIPGLEIRTVESSCCGMAGSFGYETEHHDVSLRMGELALLPAVRASEPDTLIVADGTSCRHQIADGASRTAVHAACVLELAL